MGDPEQNFVSSPKEKVVLNRIRVMVKAKNAGLLTRERMRRLRDSAMHLGGGTAASKVDVPSTLTGILRIKLV